MNEVAEVVRTGNWFTGYFAFMNFFLVALFSVCVFQSLWWQVLLQLKSFWICIMESGGNLWILYLRNCFTEDYSTSYFSWQFSGSLCVSVAVLVVSVVSRLLIVDLTRNNFWCKFCDEVSHVIFHLKPWSDQTAVEHVINVKSWSA